MAGVVDELKALGGGLLKAVTGRQAYRLIILLQISNAFAGGKMQEVGNQPGQSQFVDGPGAVIFNVGGCRFSMTLARDDHVRFNDPEAIFYHSKTRWSKSRLPYLDQARMSAGYDWSFKKNSNLRDQWFGVMCDSIANFAWNGPKSSDEGDISPELSQIFEANSRKCPANLVDGRWTLTADEEDILFKEISGRDWNGFVAGYINMKDQRSLESVKFCVIHDENVIVGASEDSSPLNIDAKFFDRIVDLLYTVDFIAND
ncbi:hypothetical protein [Cupriavidus pauculus]|uniref:Uncharacterized protein n=1 Tax=Cupriavidus pauculus TaxID=82633 RepID=A0A3G8H2I0_9BURK|nr:hypothetical protein [Cupriavidus pauculus]AZG14763.1 hypothetical protein EHF44_15750 [Cupriavidus pauculus]